MRRIVGYLDNRPVWSENQPSQARLSGVRGSLVTGEPGVVERGRIARNAGKRLARKEAEA